VGAVFYLFGAPGQDTAFEAGVSRALTKLAFSSGAKPESTVMLDIPFHRQEHSLSCEIASVRSALLYRGLDIPESKLIEILSFDPTPGRWGVWGDPHKGFVGDIDGKMFKTGYGVYWEPITQVVRKYRFAEHFSGWSTARLAQEIEEGNPVIVWSYLGDGDLGVWRTSGNKMIVGVNGEHTRVAMGYTGPKEKPTGFYLMDPIYGKIYEARADFLKKWAMFGYSGVVVY